MRKWRNGQTGYSQLLHFLVSSFPHFLKLA